MADWIKTNSGSLCYERREVGVDALIFFDPQSGFWVSRVKVMGELVDMGEWDGLSIAMRNAFYGMTRAVWLRRYDKSRLLVAKSQEDPGSDGDGPDCDEEEDS